MDAQCTLVRIYLFVFRRGRLAATAGRQSNNSEPDFTDKEVLTVYLFGLAKKRETVSEIYEYAEDHFSDWFPDLPTQESYNRRLNRLNAVFSPLVEKALEEIDGEGARKNVLRIVDSMPIMLAKGNRASPSESRFRADRGRRVLLLEGCLLPRRRSSMSLLRSEAISSHFRTGPD